MSIFTLEIGERPSIVFAVMSSEEPLDFALNGFIRDELRSLQTPNGDPFWDGKTDLLVREADDAERAPDAAIEAPSGARGR